MVPKRGFRGLIIVTPKDRACQIPQDFFNATLEALNSFATKQIDLSVFEERVNSLINNMNADSTVISNDTSGPDTSEVPTSYL